LAALLQARGVAESITKQVLRDLNLEEGAMLEVCLRKLEEPAVMSRGLVPAEVITFLHAVRVVGNKAAHDVLKIKVGEADVALVLGLVLRVLEWYFVEFPRCPTRLETIYAAGPLPPVPCESIAPVELCQLEAESVELAQLHEDSLELLALELTNGPLPSALGNDARRRVEVNVGGLGTVRVQVRALTKGREMMWDLQSELRILSTHRDYVRLLNEEIARPGHGIHGPAYVMERNKRLRDIEESRRRVADYLDAFIESAELVVFRQPGTAR
jgi:hypothetical protein